MRKLNLIILIVAIAIIIPVVSFGILESSYSKRCMETLPYPTSSDAIYSLRHFGDELGSMYGGGKVNYSEGEREDVLDKPTTLTLCFFENNWLES